MVRVGLPALATAYASCKPSTLVKSRSLVMSRSGGVGRQPAVCGAEIVGGVDLRKRVRQTQQKVAILRVRLDDEQTPDITD